GADVRRLKFQRISVHRGALRRLLQRTGVAIFFLGVASVLGLGLEAVAQAVEPAERTGNSTNGLVTFNKDVAPLIFQHCSICHRPGQAAPFTLLDYADVRKRAKQISDVVRKRYMPPWLPERGNVEFANDLSLTDDQIRLIGQWEAQGAAEGA